MASEGTMVSRVNCWEHIRILENWVDEDSKNRRMRILSKKMVVDGISLHIVTLLLFQNRNVEEMVIYDAVGISQYSRKDAVNDAASKIREKYKSVGKFDFKDKMECNASSHRTDRFGTRQKKKYCTDTNISKRYMNASLPNRDPPEQLFDDDEEDCIEKRLWNNLSEKKKIEILDRELDDYFNAPCMIHSDDEYY